MALQVFENWAIEFVGSINPPRNKTGAHYIITTTNYVNRWATTKDVKDCTTDIVAHLIFEHILTKFGYPEILMRDRGVHFVNGTVEALTE